MDNSMPLFCGDTFGNFADAVETKTERYQSLPNIGKRGLKKSENLFKNTLFREKESKQDNLLQKNINL